MEKPFYADGLRFQCQPNCGACCTQKGDVFVSREEIRRLATFLRLPVRQLRKRLLRRVANRYSLIDRDDGACIFLSDEMKCTVYAARPDQCRTYPFWPSLLSSESAWEWEGLKCPGIGQGDLIPASEIGRLHDQPEEPVGPEGRS